MKHEDKTMEDRFKKSLCWQDKDGKWFLNGNPTTVPDIIHFIHQEISLTEKWKVKQYEDIFKWLLGENGEFPNVMDKPHYAFRTELRRRLTSLQTGDALADNKK